MRIPFNSKLDQELSEMDATQIMKRHIMNTSFHNAQTSDRKQALSIKQAFDPKQKRQPVKIKTHQKLHDKMIILGKTGEPLGKKESSDLKLNPVESLPVL